MSEMDLSHFDRQPTAPTSLELLRRAEKAESRVAELEALCGEVLDEYTHVEDCLSIDLLSKLAMAWRGESWDVSASPGQAIEPTKERP